jgi:hypothetical protein
MSKCSLEITVIPYKNQLLLLFLYSLLSVVATMNLHGPGSLQVVQVDRRVTGEEL